MAMIICFIMYFFPSPIQCQMHYGARQEVASENDLRVNTLCLEWEAVLSHGFKKPKTTKLL